jgi:L-threonylcarbamoyladenylate synthase
MDTLVLSASPQSIARAAELLRSGRLVAFPTDTVYGVGSLAFSDEAVRSIYTAKDRPVEKAIPILLADVSDLSKVSLHYSPMVEKLAARFWPGPLTLVIPKHPDLPISVSATATVGVRVPDHSVARELLRLAGPLAVTSANLSGQPSPSTAQDVLTQLGGRIPLILDGGQTPGGQPSTVLDCTGTEPVILREGPLTLVDIKAALFGLF